MKNSKLDTYASGIKRGDETAFERMYNETVKGVFAYVYSIVSDYAAAQEIVQDAYIKVKLNISSYSEGSNFSAWLLQIAKNLAYNRLKKDRREVAVGDEILERTAGACQTDYDRPVMDAVKKILTEDEGRIVLMHAVGGYKHREIAAITGKPLGTVTWTYNNAVSKLKKYLKEERI